MIKFTSWDEDGYDDIVTYHIHPAKTPLVFMENEYDDGTKNYAIAIAYYTETDNPIVVDRETFERVMREYNRYLDKNATMSTE